MSRGADVIAEALEVLVEVQDADARSLGGNVGGDRADPLIESRSRP